MQIAAAAPTFLMHVHAARAQSQSAPITHSCDVPGLISVLVRRSHHPHPRFGFLYCGPRSSDKEARARLQLATDPKTGRMVVIEMNPRVSRSSALASKATGFPIAKMAAKLAMGFTLDQIPNDITLCAAASAVCSASCKSFVRFDVQFCHVRCCPCFALLYLLYCAAWKRLLCLLDVRACYAPAVAFMRMLGACCTLLHEIAPFANSSHATLHKSVARDHALACLQQDAGIIRAEHRLRHHQDAALRV